MGSASDFAREAEAAPTPTVVTFGGEMCVKKIEAKLSPMPEVLGPLRHRI